MATHDYSLANQSGASFRSDLNNCLSAVLSNNSNSSAPSTTVAYMLWADTSNAVLKIRNSANNAWIELFQLDGTLTIEDGAEATPGLAFRDDLNTGIWSSAADTFNISTAGTERLELGAATVFNESGADVDFRIEGDSNANLFYVDAGDDQIGIGTASPEDLLHIKSGKIRIENAIVSNNDSTISYDNSDFIIDVDPNNVRGSSQFQVKIDTVAALTVDDSRNVKVEDGNLKIGTAGHGIFFSAYATSASGSGSPDPGSNLLNDYEEGTFTPAIDFATTNNHTYSEQTGHYTKIGDLVTGNINIAFDVQASGGAFRISGPFTSNGVSTTRMWGVALYQHGFDIPTGGSTHIIYYAGGNTSYMNAYYVGSSDDSDLGTSGTAITGAMCSSATTLRMYFQYRA